MKKVKLLLICFSLFLVGCSEEVTSSPSPVEDCNGVLGGLSVVDCAGVCGGTATEADCNACSSGNYDCEGTCDGSVLVDCAGVCGGTATEADCNACSSGIFDCQGTCDGLVTIDCAGFCGGTATEADCNACSSGIFDCAGVCDGDAVEDCAGVCGGNALEDCAGVCGGTATEADCLISSMAGTYYQSEAILYSGSTECSGDGITGMCDVEGYEDVMNEADCPEGGWVPILTVLMSDSEDEDEGDADSGDDADSEDEDEGDGVLPSVTIMANGAFVDPGGQSGTISISDDGTTVLLNYPESCDGPYLTELECEAAEYNWSEAEQEAADYNFETGVFKMDMGSEGGCDCGFESSCSEITTENDCYDANGNWDDAQCLSIIWSR